MIFYPVYKAIKQRLTAQAVPVYFYIGQYLPGKDNTSYVVPAIYIEFPKENEIDFFPTKRVVAKDVNIKIHYISYAPFKNHDNATQEAALSQHNAHLVIIDKLLTGWNAVEPGGLKIITQQLIPTGSSLLNFMDKAVVSVITYKTEVCSSHLQV